MEHSHAAPARPRARRDAAAVLAVGGAFAAVLLLLAEHPTASLLVDNGVQLAAATVASVAWAQAVRRGGGDRRTGLLMAAGAGSWAGGQVVWSVYEVGVGREVPFPSFADVGFLGFMVLVAAALVRWLSGHERSAARSRDVLDALLISASLLALSWSTATGTTWSSGQGTAWGPLLLSLAYPVGDVALATLVLLALGRSRAGPRQGVPGLLAAGLILLAVADSAYVYLLGTGAYATGNLLSVGWVTGFLLLAVAGRHARDDGVAQHDEGPEATAPLWWPPLLPYVPLLVAWGVVGSAVLRVPGVPRLDIAFAVGLTALVLGRQLFALQDNRRLLADLARTRDELDRAASYDALTGCANRALFSDRVARAVSCPGADVTVLCCDLDGFTAVNERWGHATGDAVLRLVAERLREVLASRDVLARTDGDEFAVLLEGGCSAPDVAAELAAAVSRPWEVGGAAGVMSLSVGWAQRAVPGPAPSPSGRGDAVREAALAAGAADVARALLAEADGHLRARRAGGPDEALRTVTELRAALSGGQLVVHLQPQVDLHRGAPVGAEALVRWEHPERGLLLPGAFLPHAQRAGLLPALARVVLDLALRAARRWWDAGVHVPVSVNLSAVDVVDAGLAELVRSRLEAHGLPPGALVLEITEDTLMEDPARAPGAVRAAPPRRRRLPRRLRQRVLVAGVPARPAGRRAEAGPVVHP